MGKIFGVNMTACGACAAECGSGRPVLLLNDVPMRKLKASLEQVTKEPAAEILLAVPAGTGLYMQQKRLKSWEGTGLKVVRTVSEHTAVALCYAAEHRFRLVCLTAVVECREQTTKITLVRLDEEAVEEHSFHIARNVDPSDALRQALQKAGYSLPELQTVLILDSEEQTGQIRRMLSPGSTVEYETRQAIALGAAVYGGILQGSVKNALVLQTIPWAVGVETEKTAYTPMLEADRTIPTLENRDFPVPADASTLDFTIWEEFAERFSLGSYRISGIPAGAGQVTIRLDVNTNRRLAVAAYLPDNPGQMLPLTAINRDTAPAAPSAEPDAGNVAAVKALLPVYDNLLLAIAQPTADAAYKKGIEQIVKELTKQLRDLGAEPYGAIGDSFDPTIHNAVVHMPDINLGANQISRVFRRGIRMNGKILRVADVQVAN